MTKKNGASRSFDLKTDDLRQAALILYPVHEYVPIPNLGPYPKFASWVRFLIETRRMDARKGGALVHSGQLKVFIERIEYARDEFEAAQRSRKV